MKKFFLVIFVIFDLLVIAASVMFLMGRLKSDKRMMAIGTPMAVSHTLPSIPGMIPAASSSTVKVSTGAPVQAVAAPVAAVPAAGRKILFAYRNPKARKVMIRADFTGWRAEAMQKNPTTSKWEYKAVLEPGEYAYCFSVDDKSIRDPANKRTKQVGKTRVSSIIVQAQAGAPPH